jgi:hypothetical protein
MAGMNLPQVKYELIRLQGGLDQVTPTLSLQSGIARRAANFEASITGGYTRIAGYERFDGRPSPSAAVYNLFQCTLTGAVAVGNTITGMSSGATGRVIYVEGGTVVITRETGVFVATEGISISASQVGTITSIQGLATDGLQDATFSALAADNYRADIQAVPGSGPIRGVAYFDGVVYAWRNNSAATRLDMYQSTSSGWSQVPYYSVFDFNSGSLEMFAGETIVGHTSGATALLKAVILLSGSWSAGDAAGYAVFTNMTGAPVTNELIYIGGVKHARYQGAYAPIAPLPNGRVETVIANVGGTEKLFGVDGLNRAFSFDGQVYIPIRSGMTDDTPDHVAFHKQHLFLSFGASLQFSAIADPYVWSPVLGAGEIVMNDTITNLLVMPGDQTSGALAVYSRNDTSILYGTSSSDFKLSNYNSGTGALPYTAQTMDQSYAMDDRGVLALSTSLNYGNFVTSTLTMNIRPFIQARRNLATASSLSREKGQYRVFFSDRNALYITVLNGKLLGSMPVQFNHAVTCCVEGETPDGAATSFFGSDNGFVYRLDVGTSFDGAPIPANLNLVFNSSGSPRILKRYRKASIEMTGDSYAEVAFGYDLAYGSNRVGQAVDVSYDSDLRSSYWDEMQWDNFVFDGVGISPTEVDLQGTGENLSIRLSSVSAILEPFTVNSILIHYSMRRGLR